jgi:hypothetical protein
MPSKMKIENLKMKIKGMIRLTSAFMIKGKLIRHMHPMHKRRESLSKSVKNRRIQLNHVLTLIINHQVMEKISPHTEMSLKKLM